MHSTQALMEGHLSASRTTLLAVDLGRRRIRLPISAWKDSNFLSKDWFNIQDCAPYNRTGRMQHSMVLLDDGGFRAPLNTPQPLAKNAPLAFLTFSSIHLLLESEVDHQAPWHLAESMGNWDFNIVRPDGGGIARN